MAKVWAGAAVSLTLAVAGGACSSDPPPAGRTTPAVSHAAFTPGAPGSGDPYWKNLRPLLQKWLYTSGRPSL